MYILWNGAEGIATNNLTLYPPTPQNGQTHSNNWSRQPEGLRGPKNLQMISQMFWQVKRKQKQKLNLLQN